MPLDSIAHFEAFPKIGRLKRACTITEKIDGTNAQIIVTDDLEPLEENRNRVIACSRTRIITPGKHTDNFGFAAWVQEHEEELRGLGTGRHFGEWWGSGIQRGYEQTEKKFSLFQVHRWADGKAPRPACCGVVPILYEGDFNTEMIDDTMLELKLGGSKAAPGFMQPEGIVVFHSAVKQFFKRTFDRDEEFKGAKGHAGDGPNA